VPAARMRIAACTCVKMIPIELNGLFQRFAISGLSSGTVRPVVELGLIARHQKPAAQPERPRAKPHELKHFLPGRADAIETDGLSLNATLGDSGTSGSRKALQVGDYWVM